MDETKPSIEEMLDRILSNQNDIMCALRQFDEIDDQMNQMLRNSQNHTLKMIGKLRTQ